MDRLTLFHVNQIHRSTMFYTTPDFPIKYNKKGFWESDLVLHPFFLKNLILKMLIIFIELVALIKNISNEENHSLSQSISIILSISLILTALAGDSLLYLHGREIYEICNWTYKILKSVLDSDMESSVSIITKICLSVELSNTFGETFIALALLVGKLDTVQLAIQIVSPLQAKSLPWLFKIFQYIFFVKLVLNLASGSRVLMLLACSEGMLRGALLIKLLRNEKPTSKLLSLYRQSYIACNILQNAERIFTASTLMLLFLLVFLSLYGALLGKIYRLGSIIMLSIFVLLFSLSMIQLEFWICSGYYLTSKNILVKWKRGSVSFSRAYTKYMFAVLNSLPLVTMPVGSFGIMDLDIKMNYMYRLMASIVDGLIIKKYLLL